MTECSSAFNALVDIESTARSTASGLPAQVDVKPHWSGVGFSLFGRKFVAPMGEVAEMLELPSSTPLPGVQSWVRGVANVRGRLLPLSDLASFLDGQLDQHRRERKVLVIEVDELYCGLIVDAVYGMQHFPVDNYHQEMSAVEEVIHPYLQGSFFDGDGQEWFVFSPWVLTKDERFFQAAMSSGSQTS